MFLRAGDTAQMLPWSRALRCTLPPRLAVRGVPRVGLSSPRSWLSAEKGLRCQMLPPAWASLAGWRWSGPGPSEAP